MIEEILKVVAIYGLLASLFILFPVVAFILIYLELDIRWRWNQWQWKNWLQKERRKHR